MGGSNIGGLQGVLALAKRAAQKRNQKLTTAHILLVMLQQGGETSKLLAARGVRETDLISALKVVDDEPAAALDVAVERARSIASQRGDGDARPIHLLLAMARDARTAAHRCLEKTGTVGKVQEGVVGALGPGKDAPVGGAPPAPKRRVLAGLPAGWRPEKRKPTTTTTTTTTVSGKTGKVVVESAGVKRNEPEPEDSLRVLRKLGRDLTALAASGKIDPVVGRDREIDQLLDVLARRRANNPILVGAPGVGKTAVVEGLALRIARGDAGLGEKIVIELSAGSLVSGTGVRGALAERVSKIREEVVRANGRVLLFIDEIHAIVGGDGPDDLAGELKAALARGELPCIGATTDAEYRRCFERDPALARRFSRIQIGEPDPDAARAILRALAPKYEIHHGVAFSDGALEAAIELSIRHLPDQTLPDKAIGLVDLAGARVRRRGGRVVDRVAIAELISEQARVPLDRLLMKDGERLLALERHLSERVVGQRAAIARISDVLRKGAAGFRGRRPLGTFLLLGPTGVGKTETAKAVSDLLYPAGAMTRIDMSELCEAHSVARLIGAPPGYLGHDDGGQLTESVRRRPYQLVLLDEIEKAHPDVLLALLPLLDEGRLTDGRGRTVDFTHTVIFMTSNLGAATASEPSRSIGFDREAAPATSMEEKAVRAARRAVPPEFWNRIDEPLFFHPLGEEDVRAIAERLLAALAKTVLAEHAITVRFDRSAVDTLIGAGGFDATLGARPMKRTIGRVVEAPLAAAILEGSLRRGSEILVTGQATTIRWRPVADAAE